MIVPLFPKVEDGFFYVFGVQLEVVGRTLFFQTLWTVSFVCSQVHHLCFIHQLNFSEICDQAARCAGAEEQTERNVLTECDQAARGSC